MEPSPRSLCIAPQRHGIPMVFSPTVGDDLLLGLLLSAGARSAPTTYEHLQGRQPACSLLPSARASVLLGTVTA
jgi:hypothetical protein